MPVLQLIYLSATYQGLEVQVLLFSRGFGAQSAAAYSIITLVSEVKTKRGKCKVMTKVKPR
jgi:hypothetical protein